MKTNILFAEDEIDLGNVVKQYLEVMDFEVDWFTNGKDALAAFRKNADRYRILLLDVSLPKMDGFELANEVLKTHPHTSFLFLTARKEKGDKLYGLKIGADDYVTKPFDIDELVLRIRNIIKRKDGHQPAQQPPATEAGDVRFRKDLLTLSITGHPDITLTPREAELLEYLFNHQNSIVRREDLLTQLWGDNDYFLGRSLDVFISRLRKLLQNSSHVSIENIYGVGFIFKTRA